MVCKCNFMWICCRIPEEREPQKFFHAFKWRYHYPIYPRQEEKVNDLAVVDINLSVSCNIPPIYEILGNWERKHPLSCQSDHRVFRP